MPSLQMRKQRLGVLKQFAHSPLVNGSSHCPCHAVKATGFHGPSESQAFWGQTTQTIQP